MPVLCVTLKYSKTEIILMVIEINPQAFTSHHFDLPGSSSFILIQQIFIEDLL